MKNSVRILFVLATLAALSLSTARAAELTGAWRGTLHGSDGSSSELDVEFSEADNPIYFYFSSGAEKAVELTAPGQQIQWVPQGGGVKTVTLSAYEKAGARVSFVLNTSFERAQNGYLTQQFSRTRVMYELSREGLQATIGHTENSYLGDNSTILGGEAGEEAVLTGVLKRVR